MNLKPIRDRVVIKPLEDTTSIGGVVIPDTARGKAQIGEVILTGEGSRRADGTTIPLSVRSGDRVLFGKHSGIEMKVGEEDLLILNEDDILGILPGDNPTPVKG